VRAFSHLLGETAIGVFGSATLSAKYRRGFPRSLDGAPFLLPVAGTALRRSLEEFFDREQLRPVVVAEFSDSALLKVFGMAGQGLFAAPIAIASNIRRQYQVKTLGTLAGVRESYYAITVERRLRHPGAVAISHGAREKLLS
jgi:LysR family transcriptional activator of nhaA